MWLQSIKQDRVPEFCESMGRSAECEMVSVTVCAAIEHGNDVVKVKILVRPTDKATSREEQFPDEPPTRAWELLLHNLTNPATATANRTVLSSEVLNSPVIEAAS